MNKLLNRKVFLSFSLLGVSYTSSNIRKVAICLLNFCQCDFLLVIGLHCVTYFGILMKRNSEANCKTM